MWDGKVGLWPIGEFIPVARTTKRRKRGTPVWRDISVTREVSRRLLLEKVVPAIEDKWPRAEWADPKVIIRIQQDGPQAHIKPTDQQWLQGLAAKGLENKIVL